MRPIEPLERLSRLIADAFPGELTADLKKNLDATIRSALERMNLVTREELEVQEAVLARTREKLTALEAQVAELEQQLGLQSGSASDDNPTTP
ncbi:MAG: accessory factor UbiK family protein [Gammaproteobacteria bacterium]|nr:accessory factor UbiK family protein [Gammaproteobacteria bacterium]MDH3465291.1 accessory factor UbiK family protein [Gammaproteobacteria bacterium]